MVVILLLLLGVEIAQAHDNGILAHKTLLGCLEYCQTKKVQDFCTVYESYEGGCYDKCAAIGHQSGCATDACTFCGTTCGCNATCQYTYGGAEGELDVSNKKKLKECQLNCKHNQTTRETCATMESYEGGCYDTCSPEPPGCKGEECPLCSLTCGCAHSCHSLFPKGPYTPVKPVVTGKKYCVADAGDGKAEGSITIVDSSHIAFALFIEFHSEGMDLSCVKERATFDASGKGAFPDASKMDDCVGKFVKGLGGNPSKLTLSHDKKADTISFGFFADTTPFKTTLSPGKCSKSKGVSELPAWVV